MSKIIENYRDNAIETLHAYKKMAEAAISQATEEEFFQAIDREANSIAVIVKHIAGNQRSRFTDFLTTDGEKAERNRDSEFIIDETSKNSLMERWETGWDTMFFTLQELKDEDFEKTVQIRGEPHTVVEALNRQLTHYAYHIGQIVFLAKHFRSSDWKTLSVPKNKSAEFNEFLKKKKENGELQSHPLEGPAEFGRSN